MGSTGPGADFMDTGLDFGSEAFTDEERATLLDWYRAEHGVEDLSLVRTCRSSSTTFLVSASGCASTCRR